MKRAASFLLALLLLPAIAFGQGLSAKYYAAIPSASGEGGLLKGLTFHAPFTDPDNPLAISRGTGSFTFTRATSAWYTHPTTGLITEAAEGNLRIEANGALIEGQRTNILLRSEQIDNTSVWGSAGLTITPDNVIAPDGNQTAEKISYTAMNYPGITQQTTVAAAEKTVTSSYWIKGDASQSTHIQFSSDGTANSADEPVFAITTEWQRITGTGTYSAGTGNIKAILYVDYGTNKTGNIWIWGAQLEAAPFPSSYIPTTTAAVTRNLSSLSVASSGNIDNTAGTLVVEWTPEFASTMTTGTAYYLFDAGDLEAYYNATDQKIYFKGGDNTISTAALAFSSGDTMNLAFRWGPGGLDIYKDGAVAATGAIYTGLALNANLYIGSDTASVNQAHANIENARVWSREPSDAEMLAITR